MERKKGGPGPEAKDGQGWGALKVDSEVVMVRKAVAGTEGSGEQLGWGVSVRKALWSIWRVGLRRWRRQGAREFIGESVDWWGVIVGIDCLGLLLREGWVFGLQVGGTAGEAGCVVIGKVAARRGASRRKAAKDPGTGFEGR